MLERVLRTLIHPRLVMTSFAALHFTVATITCFWPTPIEYRALWVVIGLTTAIITMLAVMKPAARGIVIMAGSLVVFASLGRAIGVADVVFTYEKTDAVRASAAIGVAQWLTVGYVAFVIWRRQVIPYSVLERTERREVPR